jgi:hypothetical protein
MHGGGKARRVCDKHSRPILQALRLQSFLKLKTYMRQSNRVRLKVRIPKAQSTRLDSNRLSHDLIQRPHSNYGLEVRCIGVREKDGALPHRIANEPTQLIMPAVLGLLLSLLSHN